MIVSREKLLAALAAVEPGLADRDIVDQSTCYVFDGKHVCTFNGEVVCRMPVPAGMRGAVPAAALQKLLLKYTVPKLSIKCGKSRIQVSSKSQGTATMVYDTEVKLPTKSIVLPKKWHKLPPTFSGALMDALSCAGKDEGKFMLTCVHITNTQVEACNNYQACRCLCKVPVRKELLLRGSAAQHVAKAAMVALGETKTWVHFKNADGLIMSCRKYDDEYPNLDPIVKVQGKRFAFAAKLKGACERAQVFAAEEDNNAAVQVSLQKGKVTIIGQGKSGKFVEEEPAKYAGQPATFLISPIVLKRIIDEKAATYLAGLKVLAKSKGMVFASALMSKEAAQAQAEATNDE